MKATPSQAGRQLLAGTVRIFAAEALLVPTGVLTAAYLSRSFGPEGYGLLALAGAVVAWVEGAIAAALARPAIKLVSEAKDWGPTGASVVRLYALAGVGASALLCLLAAPLTALFDEPVLASYLCLFALEIPLFSLAQAHRNILVGLGRFRERAWASAVRWTARLLLVVLFAALSGSIAGAIAGSVCASFVELAVCRFYVRPRLFGGRALPARQVLVYALPLATSAVGLSLYGRMDLILLKALGGTAAEAGVYGVAQNVALLPGIFSFALAPALLSTLSRSLREGEESEARELGRQAMRAVLLLIPLAAAVAGASRQIVGLVFGAPFLSAAPLLGPLALGALALVMISVATSIIIAVGKLKWVPHVTWPLLLAATAGHLVVIPRAGARGAAWVTATLACACACVTVLLVRRLWHIWPPARTLWRSTLVGALAYAASSLWPVAGLWVIFKLAGVGALVAVAFLLLGEFSAVELAGARSLFRGRAGPALELPREAS